MYSYLVDFYNMLWKDKYPTPTPGLLFFGSVMAITSTWLFHVSFRNSLPSSMENPIENLNRIMLNL